MKHLRRVLIADDHAVVLEGLHRILEPHFEIVGEFSDGRALVAATGALLPDVVITDVAMPLLGGIEAARAIKTIHQGVKIVFLTMYPDVDYAVEALCAGGSAYVLKTSAGAEILTAIHEALHNRIYIAPSIDRDVVLARLDGPAPAVRRQLTPRKREILQLFAEGKSRKEVAAILNISIKTVEFHKYQLMKQFGLRTNAELTRYAVRLGVIAL